MNSFKLLTELAFIFSGIFAFLWLKQFFKTKAAFVGALFYLFVPYRFLLIFVRASISELIAYMFVPLTFYSFTKLAKAQNLKWVSISAISLSGVLLSQNLVALLVGPVLAGYILLLYLSPNSFKKIWQSALALVWGLLISGFTYLPSIFERKFIRFDETINLNYINHFAGFKQLIRSAWGYGFDLPGTANDQISLQIGIAQLSVFLITLTIIGFYLIRKNKSTRLEYQKNLLVQASFFLVVFIIAVLLMTQTQTTIKLWENISLLHVIDIPWRLLGVVSISAAFFSAFVVNTVKPGLFTVFLIVLVLAANRNHLRINQSLVRDDVFFEKYTGSATQYNEFTPIWRQTTSPPLEIDMSSPIQTIAGQTTVTNLSTSAGKISFDTKVSSNEAELLLKRFYFPKLEVKIDGQNKQPFKDIEITDSKTQIQNFKDPSGLILIPLTSGNHHVEVKFSETLLRIFSNFLTLLSVISALFVLSIKPKK